MGIRQRMRHRATVERDVGTTVDPEGGHVPEWVQIHGSLPCYVQPKSAQTLTQEGKFLSVRLWCLWAPLGADIREEDRVTQVTDLNGSIRIDDTLRVMPPLERETHLEMVLEEYS